jgi:hypothetical protein
MCQFLEEQDMWSLVEKNPKETGVLEKHTVVYPQDRQKIIILAWILRKSEIIGGLCLKSQELLWSSA